MEEQFISDFWQGYLWGVGTGGCILVFLAFCLFQAVKEILGRVSGWW